MAYTNFQNCTANEYKNIIYNQETHNKIKILFNNVELEDADEYCELFEVVSRVIPNGSKIFMLENLVSQEATLVLHNIDTSIIQDQVSISIGTLVSENTYEYVPIGIYNLQEIPTTDNGKTTIKLRDNSVKLDFNYNAKPLIDEHGGTATKIQILQDICTKAGITCNVSSFIGSSDLIGIYDNTITGRQYVAYLAGSAGAIPIITRTGALDFKYLNNLSIIQIPIEIVEQYSNAENFKISRVVYEDAIRKYESGNETYDTLFLDSANPYISSQEQVASIYNIVNNFEINSFKTGRILGNPAIDSYDLIQITDYDGTIFKTFANNTLRYNGKMINTFASEISFERKKENVSLKSNATFKNWAKTEIDNANAQITIQAGQIDEIEQDLANPTSTKQGKYFDLEDALDEPLIDFKMYGDTQQASEPTPSSPQPIHIVSGDNTIEICGKNLFDKATATIINGNSPTSSGVITSHAKDKTVYIPCKPNTTYTFTKLLNTPYSRNQFAECVDLPQIGTSYTNLDLQYNSEEVGHFTTSATAKYILWTFYNSSSTNYTQQQVLDSIQVEYGNQATSYQPYTGNTQEINLGKNLFDKTQAQSYKWLTYIGIIQDSTDPNIVSGFIKVENGKQYIFSGIPTTTYTLRVCSYTGTTTSTFKTQLVNNQDSVRTFTADADYIVFAVGNADATSLNQIQLEKGSQATSYSAYFTPIELCKIGTYQDKIYKDNGIWYLHKEIGKVVLDGTNISFDTKSGTNNNIMYSTSVISDILKPSGGTIVSNILSNNFISKAPNTMYLNDTIGIGVNTNGTIACGFGLSSTLTTKELANVWLSTHNTIVYYVLSTPTDTEITDTTLLEQLNRLMTLPLYKNMTHITLTPNDLQPTMKIEYYRDTSLNNTFVPKTEMNKYYTKTETNAQIQIGNASIQQSVSEVQTNLNSNNEAINTISNQVQNIQTSTSQQINIINEQLVNGVEKVKTRTGFTFDDEGMSITKGEQFKNLNTDRNVQIISNGKEISFMGYDDNLKKTVARVPELESERATIGVHRTEIMTRNNEKRTAGFYVGGGN